MATITMKELKERYPGAHIEHGDVVDCDGEKIGNVGNGYWQITDSSEGLYGDYVDIKD